MTDQGEAGWYRLGPLQAGMLFRSLLSDGAGYDIEQLHVVLDQPVDEEDLGAAWTLVARRHPALSTRFRFDAGDEPTQTVVSGVTVPLASLRLPAAPEDRQQRVTAFLAEDRKRGFDLTTPPLMRVTLFKVDDKVREIVWTFHHIILDGTSFVTVLAEVFQVYDAIRSGSPPMLPAPPPPYRRYVDWLATLDVEGSRVFFAALLAGKTSVTPLPCAEPATRPLARDGYGEVAGLSSTDLSLRLRELAERTQTTVGTIVHAAWALVLSRYTNDQDVLFGSARACRRSALGGAAVSMVGLFLNTLPARARTSDDRLVTDLLLDLRRQSIALRDHEHTAAFEIERQSQVARGQRLFETLLVFQDWELNARLLETGGPSWQRRRCALHEQPSFPLTIKVWDGPQMEVRVLFDRRQFRDPPIERLLASMLCTLEELVNKHAGRLGDVSVVPPDEVEKIRDLWNETAHPFSDQLLIHQSFERRVRSQPQAIAVEMDGVALTYAELDRRANQLANALHTQGLSPNDAFVGICLDRGPELIVALLAVAKSGAAYVPLDPHYPPGRLTQMVAEVNVSRIVTTNRHRSLFATTPTLCLDLEHELIARQPVVGPPIAREVHSSAVCCAFFTSGSTGVPNAVTLSHRAMVNTLEWVTRTFDVGSADRLLFVTSPCFDLSVYDTFGVLGAGGTVVVASDHVLADPVALAAAVVNQRITIWNSAPAALSQILPFVPDDSAEAALRLVLLSGDWIPLSQPDAVRSHFSRARVVSLGGATEAAIWSNYFPVEAIDPRWTSIPYGRPIDNCRYYLLDAALRTVPVGVPGEIYIGGACLADGYLNRPDLTRARFIPNPLVPEERVYKTGDLARYFDDGNLELLGRTDSQVKVRGFRIELGEVEAALRAVPGVKDAVCSANMDGSGERTLVGYVVPTDGASIEPRAVRDNLSRALPAFMVPSEIVVLPDLPLLPNGKVDRRSLRPTMKPTGPEFVTPSTDLERAVTTIWETLLDRRPIGLTDNFFELGGHSLLVVRLVAQLKTTLDLNVPLDRLIERPTVEGLVATILDPAVPARPSRHLLVFNAAGDRPPLVLFPGLYGNLFVFREFPRHFGAEQPVYLAEAAGADETDRLPASTIEAIAEIYLEEIVSLIPRGPIVLGGFSFGALIAFELLHRLRKIGREVPLLVSFDGGAPGYPEFLPWPQRLQAHARVFLTAAADRRSTYVRDRLVGARRRFYRLLGKEHELSPEALGATPEMRTWYERLWHLNTNALRNYRPSYSEPGPFLLLRADRPERWIGIKENDALQGWSRFINGSISVATVPGEHENLLRGSNHQLIATIVSRHIAGV